jgi:hypothetical protein
MGTGGLAALVASFGTPAQRYTTNADDSSGAVIDLAGGRAWGLQYGDDAHGVSRVIAHVVTGSAKQKPTAEDQAFIDTVVDGTTTLPELDTYLRSVVGSDWATSVLDPKALKVPAFIWDLDGGIGFMVIDGSVLGAAQREQVGLDPESPYQALYWDATHWRVN